MSNNIKEKHRGAHPQDGCHRNSDLLVDQRNRYYTGRYMTARDFQDEQRYFLSHHSLHNRLLHGWGIVCGLRVLEHPNPACRDRHVVVSPGIAIDCHGHELVLREETVVQVWEPEQPDAGRSARPGLESRQDPQQPSEEPEAAISGGPFLLVLQYKEALTEWTPSLSMEEACDPRHLEANRVQEGVCLESLLWDRDRHAGCWPIPQEDRPKERIPCRDDCDSLEEGLLGCIEADCPCKHGVPLALIAPVYNHSDKAWAIEQRSIDASGRRDLRTAPQALTHIVDYNWTHGGEINLSELIDPQGMNGELRIYFDRPLYDDPDDQGCGINEHTFSVTYHRQSDIAYPLQVLFNDTDPPYVINEEGICAAVFPIDEKMLESPVTIGDCILYVSLKCDFILDCHKRPVDGNHLKGQAPTGNGTAGGLFESWFRVIDDLPRGRSRGDTMQWKRERHGRRRRGPHNHEGDHRPEHPDSASQY